MTHLERHWLLKTKSRTGPKLSKSLIVLRIHNKLPKEGVSGDVQQKIDVYFFSKKNNSYHLDTTEPPTIRKGFDSNLIHQCAEN